MRRGDELTLLLDRANPAVLVILAKLPDPVEQLCVFSYPVIPSCSSFSDDNIHSDCAFAKSRFFLDCMLTDVELIGATSPFEEIGNSHLSGVNGYLIKDCYFRLIKHEIFLP